MSGGTTGSTSKRKTKRRAKRTKEPRTDWKRLRAMTDADVHAGVLGDPDIRPTDAAFWKDAQVVMPSRKEVVTMRLDADLLTWFRRERGYQTRINAILRAYMRAHQVEKASSKPR
jgi:uncharacterized protein (DUF4415 family)